MGRNTVSTQQRKAWQFYGWPGSDRKPVGEVRYVNGWLADQMTRLDWDILIDGEGSWSVSIKGEDGKETRTVATKQDGEEDVTAASAELLDLINWDDDNIRAVTTNLFVAGQGDYAELDNGWSVVSVIDPDRKDKLKGVTSVPFLWPHPADPKKPDAPLFSVLELLDELDWLTRQSRTQSKQRVLTSGAWFISDEFQGPNGTDFWEQFNEVQSLRMADADDLSPLRFQGPHAVIKDGANWVKPDHDYDAVIDRRVVAAIQRLAYGLPVPPEILLGMQAQSRATAFQVEENAYRAHIEPPAKLVAQVAADALKELLTGYKVEVVPNPSTLLARRNSVQDVKDAYDRKEVTGEYMREVLGIPDAAAPERADDIDPAVQTALDMAVAAPSLAQVPGLPDLVEQIRSILNGTPYVPPAPAPSTPAAPTDPANDAADEPVTAAVSSPTLSDLLADIDKALSYELAGATVMATDRARQRLGAAARSNQQLRSDPKLKGLKSAELATQLGLDGLTAAGVDVADQIAEPIDAAARWWVRRIGEAWSQMSTLVPDWTGQGAWVEESVELLADRLASHIVDTLTVVDAPPLEAGSIRDILNASSGG